MIDDPQAVRGLTMRQFLRSHNVPAHRVPFLFARFLTTMKSATEIPKLYPGIAHAVRQLSESGYRHGIVSSNDTQSIERCLEHNQLRDAFSSVCGTSRLFGKEHRLRKALKEFDANPEDSVYLGDEVRDIEAAKACGIPIVSVTWGLNSRDILVKHNPAFVCDQIDELPDQLEHWYLQNRPGAV